jgi:hypothetical protein
MKKIIFLLLIFLSVGFVLAAPNNPHGFYGKVYYSDGSLITQNLKITAVVGGYSTNFILENGYYDLVVEGTDNAEVYFYIEGLTNSIGNYDFESFAVTELDFTTSLTNPNSGSSSNDDDDDSDSSGGSSGGGGSGNKQRVNEVINLSKQNKIVTQKLEDNEENENPEEKTTSNNFLTGFAVGISEFSQTPGGIATFIIVGLFVVGGVTFLVLKKGKFPKIFKKEEESSIAEQ